MQSLLFITSNPSKADQISRYLNYPLDHQRLEIEEIQSLDLAKVVEEKAKSAYEIAQRPVLVDDTALTFTSFGKLPGPLIKWFLQELGNEGLCRLVDTFTSREAIAEVRFCIFDGTTSRQFHAAKKGTIAHEPHGQEGFGWDNIFIPDGYSKTWGEMNEQERDETSMRKLALKELQAFLHSH